MRRLAGRHAVLRLFVVWVVTAVTLFVLSSLIPEIDIPGWGSAFATAALIGLLNAVVWPLFVRLALPITVLTLGVAALLLNGFIVWMASSVVGSSAAKISRLTAWSAGSVSGPTREPRP